MHLSLRKVSALRIAILVSALGAGLVTVAAQNRPVVSRLGVPTFQHLTRNSGYIFSGTVKSVSMIEPDSLNSLGSIKITFHVENVSEGCARARCWSFASGQVSGNPASTIVSESGWRCFSLGRGNWG
jgi:hypothetical protein